MKSSILCLVIAAATPALAQKLRPPADAPPAEGGAAVGVYENPVQQPGSARQLADESDCWLQAQATGKRDTSALKEAYASCLSSRGYQVK